MSIRLAASGLALAAALTAATAARAQGFFEFYDISPRQIAGMLADEGYELTGPMLRRGDVYICNAVSISGRPMRLIVDAHRGRVLERFAVSDARRYGDEGYDRRPSRYDEDNGSDDDRPRRRHDQVALGDPDSQGDDADDPSWQKLAPTDAVPEPPAPKPKRHAAKKHRDADVANIPAASATPSPEPTTTVEQSKPIATAAPAKPNPSPSVAAVAPSAPAETSKAPVRVIKLPPPPEAAKPAQAAPTHPAVEAEKAAPVEKPKAESAHKKINDLPVGTLD